MIQEFAGRVEFDSREDLLDILVSVQQEPKVDKRALGMFVIIAAMGIGTTGAAIHGARSEEKPTVQPPQVVSLAKRARHARKLHPAPRSVELQERTLKTPPPQQHKKNDLSRVTRRQV